MRAYPNEKLFAIAKENYDILRDYCAVLEREGYWQNPQTILNRQIEDFLALYLQALLVQVANYIQAEDAETLEMILGVPDGNPLGIGRETGITQEKTEEAKKLVFAPPILLQLCSLRDVEHHSSMTGLFFDALLNIIFAIAYLNHRTDVVITHYVREYYGRIQAFIQNANSRGACVDEQYIFHKICMGDLESNTALLKKAGEDFAVYKKEAFLLEEKEEPLPEGAAAPVNPEESHSEEFTDSGDGYGYAEDEEEIEYGEEEYEEIDELVCMAEPDIAPDDVEYRILRAGDILMPDAADGQGKGNPADAGDAAGKGGSGSGDDGNAAGKAGSGSADAGDAAEKGGSGSADAADPKEPGAAVLNAAELLTPKNQADAPAAAGSAAVLQEEEAPEKKLAEPEPVVDKEAATRAALASFKAKRMEKLMNRLDELVGLAGVKEEIHSLINLIRVRKMREEYHLPGMPMSYHMVFTGNPGTGKTTVARLIAEIYRELGILSKGMMIETDRAGLVAGYVGQTALKVKEVVDKAKGGILFIDEAYTLSNAVGGNDFGTEAIDMLVKLMEDYREDLVIIVAGYTQEMENFLKSNTGLISRFNKFIDFPDYGDDELIDILGGMAKKSGFSLEEEVKAAVRGYLGRLTEKERADFGNARGIRNLFEKMVAAQANRVISYGQPTKEQLSAITFEDCKFFA